MIKTAEKLTKGTVAIQTEQGKRTFLAVSNGEFLIFWNDAIFYAEITPVVSFKELDAITEHHIGLNFPLSAKIFDHLSEKFVEAKGYFNEVESFDLNDFFEWIEELSTGSNENVKTEKELVEEMKFTCLSSTSKRWSVEIEVFNQIVAKKTLGDRLFENQHGEIHVFSSIDGKQYRHESSLDNWFSNHVEHLVENQKKLMDLAMMYQTVINKHLV